MRNRVTPMGDIVDAELRGAWLGNRGILHRGTDIVRFHASDLWIYCVLTYKDWRLPQWADGHLTVLFFHDEAVALAAGHRPCALCQRAWYNDYRDAWVAGNGDKRGEGRPPANQIDRQLHAERIVRGTHGRRLHPTQWPDVPPGAFVLLDDGPALVLDDRVVPWTTYGYESPRTRPAAAGSVVVITPPSSLGVLRAGFRPQIAAAGCDPEAAGES